MASQGVWIIAAILLFLISLMTPTHSGWWYLTLIGTAVTGIIGLAQ